MYDKYLCHDLSEMPCVATYNGIVTLKGLNKASCYGKKHLIWSKYFTHQPMHKWLS